MREHAAHIPVPTLPSHLKSSQLGFSREGGGISAALDNRGVVLADSLVPSVSVRSSWCRLLPWALLGDILPHVAVGSHLTIFYSSEVEQHVGGKVGGSRALAGEILAKFIQHILSTGCVPGSVLGTEGAPVIKLFPLKMPLTLEEK